MDWQTEHIVVVIVFSPQGQRRRPAGRARQWPGAVRAGRGALHHQPAGRSNLPPRQKHRSPRHQGRKPECGLQALGFFGQKHTLYGGQWRVINQWCWFKSFDIDFLWCFSWYFHVCTYMSNMHNYLSVYSCCMCGKKHLSILSHTFNIPQLNGGEPSVKMTRGRSVGN